MHFHNTANYQGRYFGPHISGSHEVYPNDSNTERANYSRAWIRVILFCKFVNYQIDICANYLKLCKSIGYIYNQSIYFISCCYFKILFPRVWDIFQSIPARIIRINQTNLSWAIFSHIQILPLPMQPINNFSRRYICKGI